MVKFKRMHLFHSKRNVIFTILLPYLTPPIAIGYKSCCGNFSRRYRACRRHRCHRYGVRDGLLLIQVVFTKKVQMKRSVTGDEADCCCPQRKSPCPTLVGRKTKALYEKAD